MLPFDLFNHIINVGNINRKDLINLSEICNHNRVEELFRNALKKHYGLNYSEKCGAKDLYIELTDIFKTYRKDRAVVLLVEIDSPNIKIKDYQNFIEDLEKVETYLEENYPGYKKYLKRGDIIENISFSGYRSEGIYMYNGEKIIPLNYEISEYGTPSKEFVIFEEFPPDYWNCFPIDPSFTLLRELNINRVYHPTYESRFYWHEPCLPLLVDKQVILEKGISGDNCIEIEYENQKYKVTIPDDFTERDNLYYKYCGDNLLHVI